MRKRGPVFVPINDMPEVEMPQESAQEKIYDGIIKRKLESHGHVILDRQSQLGMSYLLNHKYRDNYEATKKVNKELLANLDKFDLQFPLNCRIATPTHSDDDSIRIWPRTNREKARVDYDPRHIEIKTPNGATMFLWCVFLPARRAEGDVGYFVLSYPHEVISEVEQLLTMTTHLVREVHAKAKYIQVHGGSDIRLRGEHRWEDLVLTEEIKHAIKDDLEFWIASEEHYRKRHIPYRRGYLFEGPPGNGKTAVARTILSTYDFAAYSFNFSNIRLDDKDLQAAFEEAANSAPAAFLLEDIDRIFTSKMSYSRVTKEGLFNCLDGVATYSGLIVLATANHPEHLDKAIRHRPGRFDVPVRFSNPEYPQRLELLRRLLGEPGEHEVSTETVEAVAAGCKDMSMAFIKLVYETAAARSFKARGSITVFSDYLLRGFEQAKGYYTQMETPDDRSAGFIAQRRNRFDEPQAENGMTEKSCCEDAGSVTVKPSQEFHPTTEPEK